MKKIPFTKKQMEDLAEKYPTPFYIYEEAAIREAARKLIGSFSWDKGFKEYFAVKATPNPSIMTILKDEGCGTDCSSLPELLLSERTGITGEDIMFTSNDTPAEEFRKAHELGAIINLDDINHIAYLEKHAGLPPILSFRYNPGPSRQGNQIIGNPVEAKFGMTREQILDSYAIAKEKGVERFGLHTMVVSNELRTDYFIETARMLFDLAGEIREKTGAELEFINLGGGLGIPYKPEQSEVDLAAISDGIRRLYEEAVNSNKMSKVKLFMECGRYITGPHGYLVSTVRHVKDTYKRYIGLDACMANLMRPGMYGAYHHITVLGKENAPNDVECDVVGSLCENNDKFAINRQLPKINPGDIVVLHDAGAHGHAMGFNYNGKLRSAEFLLTPNGSFRMIRRAETADDYFTTLNFTK
ncbi:diaminopimelate decarboxylase [Candidatus Kaiserbacteria bacterium RIFCSPHIGHO2_12_FULL_53_13]|uniref:Diaminopimelate decarboxylase n=1 Tax=Candidatus Kaiserbacteria bacterium RIFCSPHIGHO2_12_FULL_53_13 TaxID=1798502 RepID=A0A1F6EBC6_9BACT|nr:MAG: diaminopimelate decarboxylase [Candidatus Kaiserbacteria bacterium RIFCSPHIGHO2_12_FULL_53_13]OGG74360.1 MAG: diaminopimelate decarboxylase [Candidatus Kaiserbacteria bacterium RIFCSPLOWO2_01_FULL_52_36]